MAVNIISSNTTLERDSLPPVPSGTLIYNSDTQQLEFTNDAGISWSGVGLTTLQEAYDAGPTINMDSNVDLEVYSSTGRLAFSVIEGGNTSGVQVNRALQIDYPDIGGPLLFFQHLTPTAPGVPIASIGGQTQASNGFSKSFESMTVQVVNDSDAAFEAETVFKNIVNNAQIDCLSTGIENKSFRTLNMQNNPITNVGVLQANVRIETPAIDMLLGTITNAGSIESQALISSQFSYLNSIEQTNAINPGGFLPYIINNQSPASNGAVSWEMTHSALNSASNPFTYLKEEHVTQDCTAGNESAQRRFYCANFGTTDEYMRFTGNANQINFYKTLDMSGNGIVACNSVANNNGSIDFSNFPGELKLYTFGTSVLNLESNNGVNISTVVTGPLMLEHQGVGNKIDLNGSLLPGELLIESDGQGVLIQEATSGNNIGITSFSSGMVVNVGSTEIRNTDATQDLNLVKQNGGNINLDCVNTGKINVLNANVDFNNQSIENVQSVETQSINGLTPQGGLSSGTSNSAILTASTAEQSILSATFVGARTAPANTFGVGDSFVAVLAGNFSAANGDTLTLRLKGGPLGTTVLSSIVVPLNNATGTYFELEIDFVVRATGAAGVGDIVANYDFSYNQASGGNFQGERKCEVNNTNFDTTVDNVLDITAQFSSASASNSIETLLSTLGKVY